MAAGAYSSIFIATPLVVQLKELEPGIRAGDARALKHRDRKAVDPYAAVPAFSEDMPLQDEPGCRRPRNGVRRGAPDDQCRGVDPSRPAALHRGGASGLTAGLALRVGEARAAEPQATVAARQAVTSGHADAALDERLQR